ncbi:MAG TPA: nucleotide sugar dehydrogenase [Stellaceae bacterium]|jgi:GDP-mannose 6-dehydrogenase|nr:nucleotide sugar dehydrogenase [Stellaceae bacterium]
MKLSVFGIGYVGSVVAGCMAKRGHEVIAVDVNPSKVAVVNSGCSPIKEPGLDERIAVAVAQGRLRATTSASEAIAETDMSFVCVGTPSLAGGKLDLGHVIGVAEQIGAALRERKNGKHSVVVRSTILPGGMEKFVIPTLERAAGKKAGVDFGVGYLPEFLREGQGVGDFEEPETVVIGKLDEATAQTVRDLNGNNCGKVFIVDIGAAEAIKYACNAWHACKVAFANEVGSVCSAHGVDGREVMDIFCADERLNISKAYLRPGFAFGGPCLPKDLRALRHHGQAADVETPLLDGILAANEKHIARAFQMIASQNVRRVSMFGVTFKPTTDDLRDSPLVELAERLIGKGYDVKIYDPNIRYNELVGANRQFAIAKLPHIASLLENDAAEVAEHAEVVVFGHSDKHVPGIAESLRDDQIILDLSGCTPAVQAHRNYHGICW